MQLRCLSTSWWIIHWSLHVIGLKSSKVQIEHNRPCWYFVRKPNYCATFVLIKYKISLKITLAWLIMFNLNLRWSLSHVICYSHSLLTYQYQDITAIIRLLVTVDRIIDRSSKEDAAPHDGDHWGPPVFAWFGR